MIAAFGIFDSIGNFFESFMEIFMSGLLPGSAVQARRTDISFLTFPKNLLYSAKFFPKNLRHIIDNNAEVVVSY